MSSSGDITPSANNGKAMICSASTVTANIMAARKRDRGEPSDDSSEITILLIESILTKRTINAPRPKRSGSGHAGQFSIRDAARHYANIQNCTAADSLLRPALHHASTDGTSNCGGSEKSCGRDGYGLRTCSERSFCREEPWSAYVSVSRCGVSETDINDCDLGDGQTQIRHPERIYRDKNVCATGTITIHLGKPQITAGKPSQIQIPK
jgi:hypothetical protein